MEKKHKLTGTKQKEDHIRKRIISMLNKKEREK